MGIKQIVIPLFLVGLFAFALLNFGISFPVLNNASTSLLSEPTGIINESFGDLEADLKSSRENAIEQQKAFESDELISGSEGLQLKTSASASKNFFSRAIGIYNITIGLIFNYIFGSTFRVVSTVLGSIIIFLFVVYVWKIIRTGDPD